jgi:hypothetical protein
MWLAGLEIFLNRKIPDPIGCPDEEISPEDAYKDYFKDFDEHKKTKSTGLLACYCV